MDSDLGDGKVSVLSSFVSDYIFVLALALVNISPPNQYGSLSSDCFGPLISFLRWTQLGAPSYLIQQHVAMASQRAFCSPAYLIVYVDHWFQTLVNLPLMMSS
jgi:hypothetical protein